MVEGPPCRVCPTRTQEVCEIASRSTIGGAGTRKRGDVVVCDSVLSHLVHVHGAARPRSWSVHPSSARRFLIGWRPWPRQGVGHRWQRDNNQCAFFYCVNNLCRLQRLVFTWVQMTDNMLTRHGRPSGWPGSGRADGGRLWF